MMALVADLPLLLLRHSHSRLLCGCRRVQHRLWMTAAEDPSQRRIAWQTAAPGGCALLATSCWCRRLRPWQLLTWRLLWRLPWRLLAPAGSA